MVERLRPSLAQWKDDTMKRKEPRSSCWDGLAQGSRGEGSPGWLTARCPALQHFSSRDTDLRPWGRGCFMLDSETEFGNFRICGTASPPSCSSETCQQLMLVHVSSWFSVSQQKNNDQNWAAGKHSEVMTQTVWLQSSAETSLKRQHAAQLLTWTWFMLIWWKDCSFLQSDATTERITSRPDINRMDKKNINAAQKQIQQLKYCRSPVWSPLLLQWASWRRAGHHSDTLLVNGLFKIIQLMFVMWLHWQLLSD